MCQVYRGIDGYFAGNIGLYSKLHRAGSLGEGVILSMFHLLTMKTNQQTNLQFFFFLVFILIFTSLFFIRGIMVLFFLYLLDIKD